MRPVENPFSPVRPQITPRLPIGFGLALATVASFAVVVLSVTGLLP